MCRHALLGDGIHAARTYLHLYPLVLRAHDRGVQALVAIALRDGDPVLEALGIGAVHVGDDGVDLPAGTALTLGRHVEDDTYGEEVIDVLEVLLA